MEEGMAPADVVTTEFVPPLIWEGLPWDVPPHLNIT